MLLRAQRNYQLFSSRVLGARHRHSACGVNVVPSADGLHDIRRKGKGRTPLIFVISSLMAYKRSEVGYARGTMLEVVRHVDRMRTGQS